MSEIARLTAAYLFLLALLALTAGSAFIEVGPFNAVLNLAIAAAKTGIIAVAFMHLLAHGVLPRLTVVALALRLAILFGLTLIDR